MSNTYDAFGDITENDFGSLGGPAVDALKTPTLTPTPEGMALEVACWRCGRTAQLTVEWPEVVFLKYGLNPGQYLASSDGTPALNWTLGQDQDEHGRVVGPPAWRPNLQCRSGDGGKYALRVEPREFEQWLARGRAATPAEHRAAFIQGEQQVSNQAHAIVKAEADRRAGIVQAAQQPRQMGPRR